MTTSVSSKSRSGRPVQFYGWARLHFQSRNRRLPPLPGIAIDLTIIDRYGHELEMGSAYGDFRPLAHHGNDLISEEAQRNRLLLAGVMNVFITRQFAN